jgi:hypothetical protein
LYGRSELKDLIDLYFLQEMIDIWNAYDQVLKKDGGMDPSMLSYLLSQVKFTEIPEYLFTQLSVSDLNQFIKTVLNFLNRKSFPEQA